MVSGKESVLTISTRSLMRRRLARRSCRISPITLSSLGRIFERCRQDLKPHLQPWAQHLSLEEQDPDDVLDKSEKSIGEQSSGDQSDDRSGEQLGDKSDVDDSEDGSVNGMASMADDSSVHVAISRDDTSIIAETCSFRGRGNFFSAAEQRWLEEWLCQNLDSEAPQGTITVLHT